MGKKSQEGEIIDTVKKGNSLICTFIYSPNENKVPTVH